MIFQETEYILNEPWWVTVIGCVTLAALFAFALIAVSGVGVAAFVVAHLVARHDYQSASRLPPNHPKQQRTLLRITADEFLHLVPHGKESPRRSTRRCHIRNGSTVLIVKA